MKRATWTLLGFWALWFLLAYVLVYGESSRLSEMLEQKHNFTIAILSLFVSLIALIMGTIIYVESSENASQLNNTTDDTCKITEKITTTTEKEKEDKYPLTDRG